MPRPASALRTTAPLAALILAAACTDRVVTGPTSAAPSALRGLGGRRAAGPARYVVQFDDAADVALSPEAVAAAGGRVVAAVPVARGLVVAGVTDPAALAAAPGVVRVEEDPDVSLDPVRPTEDALNLAAGADAAAVAPAAEPSAATWLESGVQWDLRSMRVPEAWAVAPTLGAGSRVCVIDTGGDDRHQELAGQIVDSVSFVPNDTADAAKGFSSPGLDSAGHGSHVSGTVAAKGIVMAGVAPRAALMTAKVFAATGPSSYSRVANAVAWCTDHGADVINLSLGSIAYKTTSGGANIITYLQRAMDYASSRGVIVVAAAGNENVEFPNRVQLSVPALVSGVVSVGATGPLSKFPLRSGVPTWNPNDTAQVWRTADSRAYYSNFGSDVTVFAPGGNLGFNLAWPFRYVDGRVQGVAIDGIFSVCASASEEFSPYVNSGGAPAPQGAQVCAGTANTYTVLQGTSMASPHVAGLMALVAAEVGGARTPERRERVISCVTRSTDAIGPSSTFGGGRVNALAAIQLLRRGGC